jgi:hypothetical protein
MQNLKVSGLSQIQVASNSSYLRGRGQEDQGLKPAKQLVHETLS